MVAGHKNLANMTRYGRLDTIVQSQKDNSETQIGYSSQESFIGKSK